MPKHLYNYPCQCPGGCSTIYAHVLKLARLKASLLVRSNFVSEPYYDSKADHYIFLED